MYIFVIILFIQLSTNSFFSFSNSLCCLVLSYDFLINGRIKGVIIKQIDKKIINNTGTKTQYPHFKIKCLSLFFILLIVSGIAPTKNSFHVYLTYGITAINNKHINRYTTTKIFMFIFSTIIPLGN